MAAFGHLFTSRPFELFGFLLKHCAYNPSVIARIDSTALEFSAYALPADGKGFTKRLNVKKFGNSLRCHPVRHVICGSLVKFFGETMQYFVGVYHPRPGAHTLPKGYDLPRERLANINVENLPLTIEHKGIFDAIDSLGVQSKEINGRAVGEALDDLSKSDSLKAPVGLIVNGCESTRDGRWYCLGAINTELYSDIPFLIESAAMRGLSLTHIESDAPVPVEISLCHQPARPECFVEAVFDSLGNAQRYMRARCHQTIKAANKAMADAAMTDPSAKPDVKTFDDAIEAMDENVRGIVAAAYQKMVDAVESAKRKQTEAESTRDQAEKRATELERTRDTMALNHNLVKNQLKIMSERFSPEILENYSCSPEQLTEEFGSNDQATMMNGLHRVIMACNHQLMLSNGQALGAAETSRKRRATENINEPKLNTTPDNITAASARTLNEKATPAAEQVSSDPRDILRNAIQKLDHEFTMM